MRRVLFGLVLALLVLPAAVLTAARLVQPGSGVGVRLVAFTPLGVLPWGLALLLVAGRAAWPGRRAGVRRARWPWLAGALAVSVPLGLHLWWQAPMVTGETPAVGGTPIRVLDANGLLGRVDGVGLVRLAADSHADLLVLQEVTQRQLDDMRRAGLDEGWPYAVGDPGVGTQGTMVFSRFPMGEPVRVDTEFDSWRVSVQAPDGELELLAVHAFPPTDVGAWRADLATVVSAAPGADLVVGDTNATLDHGPMRRLLDAGFRDAAELTNAGWQPTWPVNDAFRVLGVPLPRVVQIDHVFVGRDWTAVRTSTHVLDGTDHAVLLAEVAPR